ncbi:MAG: tRNA 2-selenouridine(34) synthase MnmH [Bacteroidetes bacterium]|nr:tRNA 2-selenouridine(34) synthase MnmH [Bacteroidota bacterium]
MAIIRLSLTQFLELAASHPIFDVRSPSEYHHAHIPGAHSLPLFTDEERKVVGTTYKQQSREEAIKIGLDYFGPKMRKMVEEAETISKGEKTVLVHCWRGGMRSAGVAWLLDLYGFKVYTLAGGYKTFRSWVLEQFNKTYHFNIIGGYTGSGKTEVLHQIDGNFIDLEALAVHRGSAFGAIKDKQQPSQEMFENLLATELVEQNGKTIWLEDESQRIGLVNLPPSIWKQMRVSQVYFLDIPFEERLKHITAGYGDIEKEKLVNSIMRVKKRLGGLETKTAIGCLVEDDIAGCFRVLLKYYDKHYNKALTERTPDSIHRISCDTVNALTNAKTLQTQLTIA